jgi:hypothetical protein
VHGDPVAEASREMVGGDHFDARLRAEG